MDFLREKGGELDLAEVEKIAGGEVIARPHFAQVLVRRGYVSTSREAFDRYLDTEKFQRRVERRPWAIPIRTGGSDFHGEKVKPDVELAALELGLKWLLS